jgi:hypothetical protein
MQKIALKLLVTRLMVRRQSKRIEGVQVVTTFVTLAVIALVGIYIWAHGIN